MRTPFHEHMPRQALALAGWVLFWMALEALLRALGLEGHRQLAPFLAILAGIGAAAGLAAPRWMFDLLTSVRFALTQGGFLIAAVLAARAVEVWHSLWFCALLASMDASMLAVAWKRRPYDLARAGFLLVHTAPSLVLLGALWECAFPAARQPGLWLIGTGCGGFLLGCAWMFYLKPVLKRRGARP
jgi:hypothetical protein